MTGKTLWFQATANVGGTNGAGAAKCLAHQVAGVNAAACAGTAHDFDFVYDVKVTGTVTSLWVEAEVAQGGTAGTNIATITVRKNGLATAGNFLSCTVTGAETSCEATGSVAIVAGDFLSVTVKETTGNGADGQWKTYVVISN